MTMNKWWMVALFVIASGPAAWTQAQSGVHEVTVVVDQGYSPQRIEAQEGQRLRLKFVRKDYGPCTRHVVFPTLDIRRELPSGEATLVELPALRAGEYEFKCGMNMIKGVIVVSPHRH